MLRPWAAPELPALNRLPMHAVRHPDRLSLDGTWRFQLLGSPEDEPEPALGRGSRARLLDDAGHE